MNKIVQFFVNVWNAQRNAEHLQDTRAMFDNYRARAEVTFKEYQQDFREMNAELKRLRSQVNQRGAGGRFVARTKA